MKIIAINLTDSDQTDFISQVAAKLNTEIINLNYNQGDPSLVPDDLYTRMSLGALTLEQYVIDNPDYNSPDKKFVNALMFWEPNINKIDKLLPYVNVFIKNWFMVQDQADPKWIFGNISALTKWAGSLHKVNKNDFYSMEPHLDNQITHTLIYAGRIGLNVQGLI